MSEHESREPEPDERGQEEDEDREAERKTPSEGNPWAKASSGEEDNLTSD